MFGVQHKTVPPLTHRGPVHVNLYCSHGQLSWYEFGEQIPLCDWYEFVQITNKAPTSKGKSPYNLQRGPVHMRACARARARGRGKQQSRLKTQAGARLHLICIYT